LLLLVDARGIRLSEVVLGTQHRGAKWGRTRYPKHVLLLVSAWFSPFRGKSDIQNRELLEIVTAVATKDRTATAVDTDAEYPPPKRNKDPFELR
jgi:hypothetical protein